MEQIKKWLSGKTGGTIRHLLSGLGTLLIAFGIADAESVAIGLTHVESIIGAVTWLVAWVWSMFEKPKVTEPVV